MENDGGHSRILTISITQHFNFPLYLQSGKSSSDKSDSESDLAVKGRYKGLDHVLCNIYAFGCVH